MDIGSAYASAAEYRSLLKKTSTDDDTEIDLDLLAVSRYIERRLGRVFNVDASATTRIYVVGSNGGEPQGGHRSLWIEDVSATPTTIKIDKDDDGSYADETALASTDYELFPLNAPQGAEAEPYRRIDLTNWGDQVSFPHNVHVAVVGLFGWPAVPTAIKQACIHLTGILRLETPRATKRVQDDIGSSIETSQEAERILNGLMKVYRRDDW